VFVSSALDRWIEPRSNQTKDYKLVFVDHCLPFSPFSFGHCVVCVLRLTTSAYLFGIFIHFFKRITRFYKGLVAYEKGHNNSN